MATQVNTDAPELARHELGYHHFMLGVKWVAIGMATLIVLLTLWFCTPAGFGWAFLSALVVAAVGVLAMNNGLAHSTENDNPH